jgi:hypothetical protein
LDTMVKREIERSPMTHGAQNECFSPMTPQKKECCQAPSLYQMKPNIFSFWAHMRFKEKELTDRGKFVLFIVDFDRLAYKGLIGLAMFL